MTTFKILQHASTVCGLVALGLGYYFWLKRQSLDHVSVAPVPVLRPWIRIGAVAAICVSALAIGVVNVLRVSSGASDTVSARGFVYLGIGAMAGGLVALLTLGLSFRLLGDR